MEQKLVGMVLLVLACSSADAALVSRAGGQAYYDTALNITWSADADILGNSEWSTAQSWIASLNATNYLGVNNWRLPTTAQPDASCSTQSAGDSYGDGCTGSEMGHLFNVDLISAASPGPFTDVQALAYWSGTEYAGDTDRAWSFSFNSGDQANVFFKASGLRAWAVSPGDTVVPLPAAVYLLGTALLTVAARARRGVRVV